MTLCTIKTIYQNNKTLIIPETFNSILKTQGVNGFFTASSPAIITQVLSTSSKFTLYVLQKLPFTQMTQKIKIKYPKAESWIFFLIIYYMNITRVLKNIFFSWEGVIGVSILGVIILLWSYINHIVFILNSALALIIIGATILLTYRRGNIYWTKEWNVVSYMAMVYPFVFSLVCLTIVYLMFKHN